MYRLYTNPKEKSGHIHKELQGHFSEHLGRCIYEGIYVGEDSEIPNEQRHAEGCCRRHCEKWTFRYFAGRAAALPMNTTGWTALVPKTEERTYDKHPLGRRGRG